MFGLNETIKVKGEDLDGYTNFKIIEEKITKSRKPKSKNFVHYITWVPKESTQ